MRIGCLRAKAFNSDALDAFQSDIDAGKPRGKTRSSIASYQLSPVLSRTLNSPRRACRDRAELLDAIRNRIVHMRIAWLMLVVALCAPAQDDKKEVVSVVNKLFEGMAARDADAISSPMTPDAKLVAAQDGQISSAITRDQFAERIGANKSRVVERIWNPTVLLSGVASRSSGPTTTSTSPKFRALRNQGLYAAQNRRRLENSGHPIYLRKKRLQAQSVRSAAAIAFSKWPHCHLGFCKRSHRATDQVQGH